MSCFHAKQLKGCFHEEQRIDCEPRQLYGPDMDYPVRTRDQLRPLIIAFRKARNLSQSSLAANLGVTQQALSALEGDPASASFERLLGLLSALDVDIVLRPRQRAVMAGIPAGKSAPLRPYVRKTKPAPEKPAPKERRPMMARKRDEW